MVCSLSFLILSPLGGVSEQSELVGGTWSLSPSGQRVLHVVMAFPRVVVPGCVATRSCVLWVGLPSRCASNRQRDCRDLVSPPTNRPAAD